jgi:hypothetical protein
VARQSSAKARTPVRIWSGPQKARTPVPCLTASRRQGIWSGPQKARTPVPCLTASCRQGIWSGPPLTAEAFSEGGFLFNTNNGFTQRRKEQPFLAATQRATARRTAVSRRSHRSNTHRSRRFVFCCPKFFTRFEIRYSKICEICVYLISGICGKCIWLFLCGRCASLRRCVKCIGCSKPPLACNFHS